MEDVRRKHGYRASFRRDDQLPLGLDQPSSVHGDRMGRASIASADALATNRSAEGSHRSDSPVRMAMLPRWLTLAERCPIVASQTVPSRVFTQSRKSRM